MPFELCFPKMNDSTAILARFVICRVEVWRGVLAKIEGCLGELKTFWSWTKLGQEPARYFLEGMSRTKCKFLIFGGRSYRGGPDGMRKVTGGDLGEGRARISVDPTRLHPCHINVSGGGGFNRFAHSAGQSWPANFHL